MKRVVKLEFVELLSILYFAIGLCFMFSALLDMFFGIGTEISVMFLKGLLIVIFILSFCFIYYLFSGKVKK